VAMRQGAWRCKIRPGFENDTSNKASLLLDRNLSKQLNAKLETQVKRVYG
jgi:hypothetical protein